MAIQAVAIASILLNVPVLQQITGFMYLSFVPGALLLIVLGIKAEEKLNFVIFSVGLSLGFVMLVGLLINEVYPVIGISQPLAILPVIITFGSILFPISIIEYRKFTSENEKPWFPRIAWKQFLGLGLLFCTPFLSIVGATYHSTPVLLGSIVLISLLVAVSFFTRIIPDNFKPAVITVIALSILFELPFISQHIVGFDIYEEFYVFRATRSNLLWNPGFTSSVSEILDYNGMLSVTILPIVYSNFLNLSGEWVFRVVYLLFYSFVPLAMYQMYKQPFGKSIAFLGAFYFILFPRFYEEERRQIIGELFLVLLMFLFLSTKISMPKKQILAITFGATLVVSHYSIYYIFMFAAASSVMLVSAFGKLRLVKTYLEPKRLLSPLVIAVILFLGIGWYTFAVPHVGGSFYNFASGMMNSFTGDFMSMAARGSTVSDFVSPDLGAMTLASQADAIINKIPYILVIVGFIGLVKKYRAMSISTEFFSMISAGMAMLAATLIVPTLAPSFLPQRFYHVSLILLAPVCIFGGVTLMGLLLKPLKKIRLPHEKSMIIGVLCTLFIIIFLFKVGFVGELTNSFPYNIPLSFSSMQTSGNTLILAQLYNAYSPPGDVQGAIWLAGNTHNKSNVYADDISEKHVLTAYAQLIVDWDHTLRENTTIAENSYLYLRCFNLKGVITSNGENLDDCEIIGQTTQMDKLYSNGENEIWYLPAGLG